MERKNKGFTIVELLTAVAIVALLIGILLPALTYVRNTAKETMQKAQIATIELALTAFKNDYGDYPPSDQYSHGTSNSDYCGAQKLAEALLGWDLMGFHPKSAWRADGMDITGITPVYNSNEDNLRERKGPYLELASANAFRLGISALGWQDGIFDLFTTTSDLNPNRYVLCDVFSVKKIIIVNPFDPTKTTTYNAGTPILYYRANTSSKQLIDYIPKYNSNIYNAYDNSRLVYLGKVKDRGEHKLWTNFYSADGGIVDPKVVITDPNGATKLWPYRPDSYILISAGVDGEYGTKDDITNF